MSQKKDHFDHLICLIKRKTIAMKNLQVDVPKKKERKRKKENEEEEENKN